MKALPATLALAALALAAAPAVAALPACPGGATLTVYARNPTGAAVDVTVDGTPAADAVTCTGGGTAAYHTTLHCAAGDLVRCGTVPGLQPGAWIHRLAATLAGSDPQQQAQRTVVTAGAGTSNVVEWAIFPRTVTVASASADALVAALDAASSFTATHPGLRALVTFSPTAFPGASAPATLFLLRRPCALAARNTCAPDGQTAGLCLTGSGIVVDALDADARPGGVVLSADTCGRQLLRVYGSDVVLRGLTFAGSRKPDPQPTGCQADTVGIVGSAARRDRIEQSLILGPSCGDAVSVEAGAGQADESGPGDAVVVDSRITGAADKGVKIVGGGQATITRSCVHDNRNGGIQATLGGHAVALENVVQHNVAGRAQNGLSAGGTAARSTLATEGNVVRFSGGRGLSVNDNASGDFRDDYVADNQFAGGKIETTPTGPPTAVPSARFRGVAFVCNRHENLTGTCDPPPGDVEQPCATVADCCTDGEGVVDQTCLATARCAPGSFPRGFGAVTAQVAGHAAPDVDFGSAADPGMNAFSSNKNTPAGANFRTSGVGPVTAAGNQWEHCGTTASCDVAMVAATDVSPVDGSIDVGTPEGPRADAPVLLRVSPPRPRAGDVVRIYGEHLNAIEGNPLFVGGMPNCASVPTCAADGTCPNGPCVDGICPCTVDDGAVHDANVSTRANRIVLSNADGTTLKTLEPDAVTPTMLVFQMPFDCWGPLGLQVTKRDPDGGNVFGRLAGGLCDRSGCTDQPAGEPCDDQNACTDDDHCDGAGQCVPGTPVDCGGSCFTCDPAAGCMQKAAGTKCDDGNACTAGERCDASGTCVPDHAVACGGQCFTGTCDPASGCVPEPADASCSDGTACTTGDHCSGTGNVCIPGTPVVCQGQCLTGACDARKGCVAKPTTTACDDGNACTVGDHCTTAGTCVPTGPRACADACDTGACDPSSGCTPSPAGTVCRDVAGPCDVVETCDGTSGACPADGYRDPSTVCRAAAGPCDLAETCTGSGPACPEDVLQPEGTTCRAPSDPCVLEDLCTGTSPACPVAARVQTDFESVSCAFERTTNVSACSGQPVPAAVARLFHQAAVLVDRAAAVKPAARHRLLQRARPPLGKAITLTLHASRRKRNPISNGCASALREMLLDARTRLAGG